MRDVNERNDKYGEKAKRKPAIRLSTLAKKLIISGENPREFEEFRASLLSELLPRTKVEEMLSEKIISCAWRLQRAQVVERNLLNAQNVFTDEERYDASSFDSRPLRRRIRNIKRIDLTDAAVQYVAEHQIALQKVMNKTLERLRAEKALRIVEKPE